MPAGPDPITATFFPVSGAISGIDFLPVSRSISATYRSIRPIETDLRGSFLAFPTVQVAWHWVSWGHTRPQIAGRRLLSLIILTDLSKSPSSAAFKKAGMFIATGQP